MRLLDSRTLEFKEFFDEDSMPKYAILSHTWAEDEVTFKDMQEDKTTAMSKAGFKKIDWCAKQALKDSLNFFWVDTCCIDKSSSAELSEAINSMFRWYRNSKVCYAYLFDVPAAAWIVDERRQKLTKQFKETLANAWWFKRGWTLQELIAPHKLIFYSNEWEEIGTKSSLGELITEYSGVPESVLRSGDFFERSVAQRMSWAATRSTTRVEDMSYCLMRLFEINMPLLYGEGKHAFIRLQEEIIKRSDDMSIFVWTDPESNFSAYRGLLARKPSDFARCKDVVWDRPEESPEPEITSKGVKLIDVNLKPRLDVPNEFVVHFPGVTIASSWAGIYLQRLSKSQFARVDAGQLDYLKLDNKRHGSSSLTRKLFGTQNSTIFIRERPIWTDLNTSRLGGIRFDAERIRRYGFGIVVARDGWDAENMAFSFKNLEDLQNNPLIQLSFRHSISDILEATVIITLDASKKLEYCMSAEKPLKGTRYGSKMCFGYTTSRRFGINITVQRKMVNDNFVLEVELLNWRIMGR